MATSNITVSAIGKSPLMTSAAIPGQRKSGRPQRVTAKAARRRDLPKTPGAISYEALAEDPIYRRIAREVCPEDLAAEITRYGFESAAAIAACRSVPMMKARMARAGTRLQAESADIRRLLRRSRREALRSYRLMRHELAVNDPMNQALRHMPPGSARSEDGRSTQVQAYAKPTSLQSNQSPAAYLRYLYRMATERGPAPAIFSAEDNPFALVNRRPDFGELVLDQAGLKREIPTIQLVNEVLRAGISDFDMSRHDQTVALPYDHTVTTARTAMSALGGARINDIALRTSRLGLGAFTGHRWAQDTAGLIGVLGAEDKTAAEGNTLLLVSQDTDDHVNTPNTLGGLFPPTSSQETGLLDPLMSALGLDADGLAQLCGLYTVAQENGEPVEQRDFATAFLANAEPVTLRMTPEGKAVGTGNGPFLPPELRVLNYLARLHHGTGLDFHELNMLLALPGAAAYVDGHLTSNDRPKRRVTATGLRLLASYPLYREAFDLAPAGFAALFGEISPYRRADQTIADETAVPGLERTEQSFMATLFNDDAPEVHRLVVAGKTSIRDETLGAIVARGFGLSALELEKVVDALDESFALSQRVDARGLAALYRMVTLCRMLGWPVLSGLALMKQLSDGLGDEPSLWKTLTSRNETEAETDALSSAVEWLADLARWMGEAELDPDALLALLASPPASGASATDADVAWFDGVASAYAPVAMRLGTFAGFVEWSGGSVSAETWLAHMTGAGSICDGAGVFLQGVTRDEIEAACRACLTNGGIDPGGSGNLDGLPALVEHLVILRDRQAQAMEAQVAAVDAQISSASAASFLRWAQVGALDLLRTALKGAGDDEALQALAEIRRHVAVVSTLELGEVELAMLANTPEWIAPELADEQGTPRPLDLAQLVWLHRFGALQMAPATDAALRGYLVLTNADDAGSDMTDETRAHWVAGSRETLALFLSCPPEDMGVYADALIGPGAVARDVSQIDLIARHVRLAAELGLSARDLLALKRVSTSGRSEDWSAAAAAQAGVARFDDGNQMAGFRHRLAERERDALVPAFMQTRIAGHEDLKRRITDSEQLYSYLLLDVNVTSAVPTSRIVEAISSLQLFISRALADLDPGVGFVDADGVDHRDALAARWEIDKDYRQWEANQKLMLYPQNYIEPELRQITSPEFDALQQAVSGGDITPDSVEAAVNAYMKDLAGACDLSMCSFYAERRLDDDGTERTLYHVLAKAKWEPGRFFYRKLEADYQTIAELQDPGQYLKAMDWTYWQEVAVPKTFELFSDVTVCVFKNRYYFFWLELEERRLQVEGGSGTGQHKSLWRLHPRYMRCDQNALAGPMLIPGLFLGTDPTSHQEKLTVDGAFQWSGAKPTLGVTYHPTQAPAGAVNGSLQGGTNKAASQADTLIVTFGIDFGVDLAAASRADEKDEVPLVPLHIRLSDEWSDAILNPGEALITQFATSAPNGYSSIHPRPVADQAAHSEPPVSKYFMSLPDSTDARFEYPEIHFHNGYDREETKAVVEFNPGDRTNASLGSIDVSLTPGTREFFLLGQKGFEALKVEETEPCKISARWHLEFETKSGERRTVESRTVSQDEALLARGFSSTSAKTLWSDPHVFLWTRIPLPDEWQFDGSGPAILRIKAKVERRVSPVDLTLRSNTGKPKYLTSQGRNLPASAWFDVETLVLHPPRGKTNTAWAQTGEHGSRNFMHLADEVNRTNAETFLLSNSSSVLSALAKTMPRPGGCETLFLPRNQSGEEDFGTFLEDFETTLDQIYQGDETGLSPERIPAQTFDFDSAYGAYGWEVFYHIPSAIAAGYASSGQFDLAMQWLRRIFDPQLEMPWRVKPLHTATEPTGGLAFDTGDVIVDPDRIARDYPFYYQQTTIRNMLEVLLDAGDAEYERQTQESLQRAKALYVSAKQLFSDNLSDTLEALTATPWTDPTLGEAARDGYDGFLPPYNGELRGLHATLEGRLSNLRHWLDLDGQPLNVPLLAQPIDPLILQRTAKSRSTPGSGGGEAAFDSPLGFPYVIRAAKGHINNLKLTSHRLQDASEKEGGARLEEVRMDAAVRRSGRTVGLQDFAVEAAGMEVAIKTTKVAKSTVALGNHTMRALEKAAEVFDQTDDVLLATVKGQRVTYKNLAQKISAGFKSTIPNTFGFSNGGQNLEQADLAMMTGDIVLFLYHWNMKSETKALKALTAEAYGMGRKTAELAAQLALDGEELAKASMAVAHQKAIRDELSAQHDGAKGLRNEWNEVFGGTSFYKPFREDLEALYAEEWATTQDFCRLLVQLYEDETELSDGATFLRTKSLGGDIDKFNAPHRLALDIERLEMAYVQAILERESETTEVTFLLGELPAIGSDRSAFEELTTQGEVYFELTEEMFDVFYPGQYDRRIQSINIRFPGLAGAGLSPHARLTQVSNTRFMTPDRDLKRGAGVRKDRHGLQSLMLGACKVDTAHIDAPDGLLKRFQNTGVDSCWHMVIPAVHELKSSKAARGRGRDWRAKAEKHYEALKPHMTDMEFTVRFSGRWAGAAELRR
nr:neuraminidase-like domain-containing protein [uncultured Halomonas sp.]